MEMKEVIEQLIESMELFVGDGRLATIYAKFVRKTYIALVSEGFTRKEAMEIITKMQMPSMGKS